MITIDRTVAGESREFHVYTKAEADDQGIDYTDWRLSREGLWVLTDDGYVGECLKVQRYPKDGKDRIAFFFTFSFARKWLTRKKSDATVIGSPSLKAEGFLEKGAYYQTAPKSWIEAEITKTRTQRAIGLYATLFVATNGHLTDEEWTLIGKAYRPSQEIPKATIKRLFKNRKVQDMAASRIAQLFEDAGVTRQSVVENLEKLRKQATEDGSYNTAFRALEKQMKMLGMEDDLSAIVPDGAGGDGAPQDLEDAEYEVLDAIEENLNEEAEAPEQETKELEE